MPPTLLPVIAIILIMIALAVLVRFVPFGLYLTAQAARAPGIDFATLIGMRLRKTPPERIILPLIACNKAGVLDVTVNKLEAHYLAKGNVDRVVNALISAHRAGMPLTFEQAAAIDLAGKNVLEAVQMAIHPKCLQLPPLKVVTRDGVETESYISVTLKSRLDRYTMADEAALSTRLSREFAIAIAAADSYQAYADNPTQIVNQVLTNNLDEDTAYENNNTNNNGVMPLHTPTAPLSQGL